MQKKLLSIFIIVGTALCNASQLTISLADLHYKLRMLRKQRDLFYEQHHTQIQKALQFAQVKVKSQEESAEKITEYAHAHDKSGSISTLYVYNREIEYLKTQLQKHGISVTQSPRKSTLCFTRNKE